MISFQHTVFGYQRPLISIENLTLESGKVYALLGLNGSGKSTFLKTLAAQTPLLAGSLTLNNYPLAQLAKDGNLRAQQIAFVSSRFDGIEHLTVFDYVALGRIPYLSVLGKMTALDQQRVIETLKELALTHLTQKRTKELSDGEKQLVSLARAFVQDTPLLLLDEPSSFLDFLNRENLLLALLKWVGQGQRCVLLSSHDIDLCLEHNLPILALAGGQIQELLGQDKKEVLSILLKGAAH
ncbi:MAG: ABC transporter ATP-binding protein [Flavobacteriales bacterium]